MNSLAERREPAASRLALLWALVWIGVTAACPGLVLVAWVCEHYRVHAHLLALPMFFGWLVLPPLLMGAVGWLNGHLDSDRTPAVSRRRLALMRCFALAWAAGVCFAYWDLQVTWIGIRSTYALLGVYGLGAVLVPAILWGLRCSGRWAERAVTLFAAVAMVAVAVTLLEMLRAYLQYIAPTGGMGTSDEEMFVSGFLTTWVPIGLGRIGLMLGALWLLRRGRREEAGQSVAG